MRMWVQEPLYDLPCMSNVYNRKLTNWHYYLSWYQMKTNRNIAAPLQFTRPTYNRRRKSKQTRLKISKANKGKRLGCAPWNKGKKLNYITGKREHSEVTKKKMSEAAKRRWMQHH
jgi:NUMOD3 motif-containing protein